MKMVLCGSARMSGENDKNCIRISAYTRTLNGISLDSILVFKTITGESIALRVKRAFLSDINLNNEASFVSEELLSKLEYSQIEIKVNPLETPEVTLGCDPEFFITTITGGVVSAGAYFSKDGPVGHDGILCELRPFPSKDPEEVTTRLKDLLLKVRHAIPGDMKMLAASCLHGMAAGFHVHMGIPKVLLNGQLTPYILAYLTRVLDFYVGIPATRSEKDSECLRRTSVGTKYGKIGDYRHSLRTLEYRVPGGSMLKTPVFAVGLLALSKIVVQDAISRMLTQTQQLSNINVLADLDRATREVYPNIPTSSELRQLFERNDVRDLKHVVQIVKSDLTYMQDYNKYADLAEKLFESFDKEHSNDLTLNWLT